MNNRLKLPVFDAKPATSQWKLQTPDVIETQTGSIPFGFGQSDQQAWNVPPDERWYIPRVTVTIQNTQSSAATYFAMLVESSSTANRDRLLNAIDGARLPGGPLPEPYAFEPNDPYYFEPGSTLAVVVFCDSGNSTAVMSYAVRLQRRVHRQVTS